MHRYSGFKSGVEKTEDEAGPGRPFSVRNERLIAKLRKRIQEERCVTVRMIADEFGVNRETISQILVEDLSKRKVASRFVPYALSDDQRHERVQYAKDIIKTARRKKNSLNSIVAEDETWCFRYDPTTKRQSAEWKSPATPKVKKSSSSKVKSEDNACVFLRQQGNYSRVCP